MANSSRVSPWYLQPRDQLTIAVATAVALALVGGYWWVGSWRHGLVELDQVERGSIEFLVDVNSAEWTELAQLPGIGETLARRIVERRVTAGPYRTADDLLGVPGIGKKTLEGVRPHLVFSTLESSEPR